LYFHGVQSWQACHVLFTKNDSVFFAGDMVASKSVGCPVADAAELQTNVAGTHLHLHRKKLLL
jgi:hypothetical protein